MNYGYAASLLSAMHKAVKVKTEESAQ